MIRNTLPASLIDHPRLDQWIAFEPAGTVRLSTGKVEIGQGILTALAQIAAEELDVAPERLRVRSGETGRTPNEGYTAGSLSIEVSGGSIRLVCADVRARFLDAAAAGLACEAGELSVADGRILRDGQETGLDYWALAGRVDLAREVRDTVVPKHPDAYRLVGRSAPRLDLPAKVFGAPFIHDLAPEGLLHARVLHRPWRDARLARFDEAAARRAAGGQIDILREGDLLVLVGCRRGRPCRRRRERSRDRRLGGRRASGCRLERGERARGPAGGRPHRRSRRAPARRAGPDDRRALFQALSGARLHRALLRSRVVRGRAPDRVDAFARRRSAAPIARAGARARRGRNRRRAPARRRLLRP